MLPFTFDVDGDLDHVSNGGNLDDSTGLAGGSPNFFATCDPFSSVAGSGGTNCSSVYLFLDDGRVNDDHDDFLVRITVPVPVPEPTTLGLLGLGFLGLVGRRLRTRSSGIVVKAPAAFDRR